MNTRNSFAFTRRATTPKGASAAAKARKIEEKTAKAPTAEELLAYFEISNKDYVNYVLAYQAGKKTKALHVEKLGHHRAELMQMIQKRHLYVSNHEHYDQVRIFDYLQSNNPDLYQHLFAVGNGGDRNAVVGASMRAEGVKRGVSDMTLQLPRGAYHGAWIELKAGTKKRLTLSPEQIEFLQDKHEQNYFCYAALGWKDAVEAFQLYYSLSVFDGQTTIETQATDRYWKR